MVPATLIFSGVWEIKHSDGQWMIVTHKQAQPASEGYVLKNPPQQQYAPTATEIVIEVDPKDPTPVQEQLLEQLTQIVPTNTQSPMEEALNKGREAVGLPTTTPVPPNLLDYLGQVAMNAQAMEGHTGNIWEQPIKGFGTSTQPFSWDQELVTEWSIFGTLLGDYDWYQIMRDVKIEPNPNNPKRLLITISYEPCYKGMIITGDQIGHSKPSEYFAEAMVWSKYVNRRIEQPDLGLSASEASNNARRDAESLENITSLLRGTALKMSEEGGFFRQVVGNFWIATADSEYEGVDLEWRLKPESSWNRYICETYNPNNPGSGKPAVEGDPHPWPTDRSKPYNK